MPPTILKWAYFKQPNSSKEHWGQLPGLSSFMTSIKNLKILQVFISKTSTHLPFFWQMGLFLWLLIGRVYTALSSKQPSRLKGASSSCMVLRKILRMCGSTITRKPKSESLCCPSHRNWQTHKRYKRLTRIFSRQWVKRNNNWKSFKEMIFTKPNRRLKPIRKKWRNN